MKMEKAMKSAPVTPEYLLARYCWIYHSPSRKEDGRDEVGIDVDRLVVDIRPTAERSVSRA